MSNQQQQPQQQEERGIVTRVTEQVDAREAIALIDTLSLNLFDPSLMIKGSYGLNRNLLYLQDLAYYLICS
jgi:hypothetical protein